jgi:DNA uptake protein ComE-like DNA-binding protein
VEAAGETAREEIERAEARAKRAEASVKNIETARLDAEAEARSAAAEWLRGQTRALQGEAERRAVEQAGAVEAEAEPTPEDDTSEQKAAEAAEPRVGFLRRQAEARRRRRAEKERVKPRRRGGPLDVNKASFEQFREIGMSVTQATRVIAYRERHDGFDSVDDLNAVPGMSKKLTQIRDQLTA